MMMTMNDDFGDGHGDDDDNDDDHCDDDNDDDDDDDVATHMTMTSTPETPKVVTTLF